jgi:Ca2+-binding EF-hand superfamily protein
MRDPWQRFATFDLDGDGAIHRNELPRQFQITLVAGAPNYASMNRGMMMIRTPGGGFAPPQPGAAGSSRGPLWFRKMDRNGDGEVSAREFLGSRDDFRRIDANGDGFISLEEAEHADAKLRARKD